MGVKRRLMLSGHVGADTVIEFQARTTPAAITQADIYDEDEVGAVVGGRFGDLWCDKIM